MAIAASIGHLQACTDPQGLTPFTRADTFCLDHVRGLFVILQLPIT